jgi:uncharacterized coiled-coil protein SlyX
MRIDVYHHFPWKEVPPWVADLKKNLGLVLAKQEAMMATLEELNGALATISSEVDKVSADTDNLLTKLANIPTGGLTQEQQAAIDSAVESANKIAERLKAIDDKVPDETT